MRPWSDEVHWSARWGPRKEHHGHHDAGSVTLYGYGERLLYDPGIFAYERDAWQRFFRSRAAHDVVVTGRTYTATASPLVRKREDERHIELVVDVRGYSGVTYHRRVIFSKKLHYLVVEDRLSSSYSTTFTQLWHLGAGTRPVRDGARVATRRARGNVTIRQLASGSTSRLVKGEHDPIQGWLSLEWRALQEAPVVEAMHSGRSARYVTLIVPSAAAEPGVVVKDLSFTNNGFRFRVRVPGGREQVVALADGAVVKSVSGG